MINLNRVQLEDGSDRDGFRVPAAGVATALGAARIGATLYELPPGQQICPYHYHHGMEEWAVVLAGRPTVRTPEGERVLEPGDAVCFPSGPDGAHTLRNDGEEAARVLLISTKPDVSIPVYPDSDKLGTRMSLDADRLNFRRADAVDYWEGES